MGLRIQYWEGDEGGELELLGERPLGSDEDAAERLYRWTQRMCAQLIKEHATIYSDGRLARVVYKEPAWESGMVWEARVVQ